MSEHPAPAITPARMELIRAAVALNPAGDDPAFEDRALLLAELDRLEACLKAAERTMVKIPERAAPEINGCCAVVLYFGCKADADEFAELMQQAKPNLRARTVE